MVKKYISDIAKDFGLLAWAGLLLKLAIAALILEVGLRGFLAIKANWDSNLPVCYDFVTVRCRTPDYYIDLTPVIRYNLFTGVSHTPNYQGKMITTNSYGMRGGNITAIPQPGVLRVIVIGGSAAWGTFVKDDETIPYYLQIALQTNLGRPVEVLNAAVTSATSFQELARLQAQVLWLKPDVVIIYDGRNDVYFGSSPRWDAVRTPALQDVEGVMHRTMSGEATSLPEDLWRVALRYSKFISTLDLLSRGWITARQNSQPVVFNREALTAYQLNLKRMAVLLKAEGITPIFVLQPILQPDAKVLSPEEKVILSRISPGVKEIITYYPEAQRLFAEFGASDPNILALDYTRVFANEPAHLYFDDVHYLPRGNYLIAQKLAEEITPIIKKR